jgi:RNA polymerase sigma-70 factor (ECF subfamily)
MAFLVLLEKISAAERAVFLLYEVFVYDYDEIGEILDTSEAACRQLFSRAKKHIQDNRPRYDATSEEHEQILMQFLQVVNGGNLDGLVSMLADEVVLLSDGGTLKGRATRPIYGVDKVARFVLAIDRLKHLNLTQEVKLINGQLGVIVRYPDGKPYSVVTIDIAQGKIRQIHLVANSEKLKHI